MRGLPAPRWQPVFRSPRRLISCDDAPGSARVMEQNGFVLADKVPNTIGSTSILTCRYWKNL